MENQENSNNKHIEVLVRGIIKNNEGKVLVCRKKGRNYYFFPGGHVEYGESAKNALARELKEELGVEIKEIFFLGGTEHEFTEDNQERHEINLIFSVKLEKLKIESKENHLQFFLLAEEELKKEIVFPEILKENILKWSENKKIFWASEILK